MWLRWPLETVPFIYDRYHALFSEFERLSIGAFTVEDVARLSITAANETRLIILPGEELRRLARKFPILRSRLSNEVPW
jgi:hypothetical protein